MVYQKSWLQYRGLARLPSSRSLLFILVLYFAQVTVVAAAGPALRNFTIPVTSPQIVYTPFVCNSTAVAANPQLCNGAWQLSDPSASSIPVISAASGPFTGSSNLIPQLFFQFRASALSLTTLPSSNATANIAIVSNGTAVSALFDSSLGSAAIINLPENATSLFTITLVPSASLTWFSLQSITLTALADIPLTSLFPTPTLPASVPLTSFTIPTTSTSALPTSSSSLPSHAPSNRKMIAEAVGITVGLGLGLTALAVLGFFCWKRGRRRRRTSGTVQPPHSEWKTERRRRP